MNKTKFAFLIAFFTFGQLLAKDADPVVATVNGKKITLTELNRHYEQTLAFVTYKNVTKRSALDDLINKIIGADLAKAEKIQNDPVVQSKIDEILYHAKISKDLESKLKAITVSDDEVKKYYSDNQEYRTAHILFRLKVVPSADEVKNALEASLQAYNQVASNPDDFSKVANSLSQSSTSASGGDLGFQPPTSHAYEYFQAIKGQKIGFISKPVRTQFGFHIIKILGVKSFEEIDKNIYKKIVYDLKRDQILQKYFDDLQSKAKIVIKAEIVQDKK